MNRESKLKEKFNKFLASKFLIDEEDYYKKLNTEDFFELKSFLNDINNIITLKMTLNFVKHITKLFNISKNVKETIIKDIQKVNPNTNGFDVEIRAPIKIVAEVKGNIPINDGTAFGSAQRNNILKDLKSLKNGKTKSDINTEEFYKFFVLPDTEKTRKALESLLSSLERNNDYKDYSFSVLSDKDSAKDKETIYIVFVSIS